jgi:UPF0176 protein
MSNTSSTVRVAALYHFARFEAPHELRTPLAQFCCSRGIKGTLLLAGEGINGTVAGTDAAINALVERLRAVPGFAALEVKYSTAQQIPFYRMKVRLKREIVTMGMPDLDPADAGTYVEPSDWNALIADPRTLVIDTRNDYEAALGTFRGAVDPGTKRFSDFPAWVDAHRHELEGRPVAMFCTGGIRCEKATAYVRSLGLDQVFHLRGGILKYLEEVPREQSRWEGECFVFDERVAVGHGLEPGEAVLCRACRRPLSAAEQLSPHYREGIACQHCVDARSDEDRTRYAERQRQMELAASRGLRPHIGS